MSLSKAEINKRLNVAISDSEQNNANAEELFSQLDKREHQEFLDYVFKSLKTKNPYHQTMAVLAIAKYGDLFEADLRKRLEEMT